MKWTVTVLISASVSLLTQLSGQITGLSGWDICIDPGHSQTQNMGVSGFSEAEEVLRVGLQVRDLLRTTTDIDTVYMTRTNDNQQVGLYDRSVYANNVGASWFHSIHSNAGSPTSNNTLLLWGQLYNGTPDPPVGGESMSAVMIDLLTRGMRIPTIGSWGDCSFYSYTGACSSSWPGPYLSVNRNTLMPSELSEEGHHTNPAQNQLDMNSEYQRLLAYTFYWSILKHHNIPRPAVRICTGIVRNLETGLPINGANISIGSRNYVTDTYTSLFHQYTNDPDAYRNGFYFLEDLPDSDWTLIVTADGYYPDTLTVTPVDTFFTFRDIDLLSSQPPYVTATTPADGDTAFPAWDPIEIQFNRAMDPVSVEAAFQIEPVTTGSFTWWNQHRRMQFIADSIQFVTDYTISVDASALDIYGHNFDGDGDGVPGGTFILQFRTSPSDIDPPEIQSVYPAISSNNVELNPIISVTFDEPIGNPDTLVTTITLENFTTSEQEMTDLRYYSVADRSVVNLVPQNQLLPQSVYIYRVGPGMADAFGNTVGIWRSFSFQTGSAVAVTEIIDDFESGITSNWWEPAQSGSSTGFVPDSTGRFVSTEITNLVTESSSALEIRYGWVEDASDWLIREYLGSGDPRGVTFTGQDILQCYVFGDGSGNQFRFAVDDHLPASDASYHEVSPWFTVDWIGWKRIRWNMATDGTGTWLGDGILDGNLRIDSIQLTHVANQPQFGRIIFDDLTIVTDEVLAVKNEIPLQPTEFSLSQNVPNPFNPDTRIEYTLKKAGLISLTIYNLRGQAVRHLVSASQSAGKYKITWNGRDDWGRSVSTGTYIYRLETGERSVSRKMALVK
ncbi:MAG: T9SS type A sorting domain-containing protein [FCB group bacterium]|nr:T9SS type A sorting domain-containing protein [FCB group bacterium]